MSKPKKSISAPWKRLLPVNKGLSGPTNALSALRARVYWPSATSGKALTGAGGLRQASLHRYPGTFEGLRESLHCFHVSWEPLQTPNQALPGRWALCPTLASSRSPTFWAPPEDASSLSPAAGALPKTPKGTPNRAAGGAFLDDFSQEPAAVCRRREKP